MKKIIVSFICFCLIFSFTACDKTNTPSGSTSDKGDVASASSQMQAQTEPVRPETVTEIHCVEFLDTRQTLDGKKYTYYDKQNGNTLPYRLYIPKNYSASKKYPVILFLHGAGELGTDNEKQLNNLKNMFTYNGDIVAGAFIICPQTSEWWDLDRNTTNDNKGMLSSAVHLLQEVLKKYSCDSNRVYVMGLSMGGYATWDLLEKHGDIFAAGVPICGGGNSSKGSAYVNIPIKIYHGTDDPTVSFSNSQSMYNAIVKAGGKKVEFIQLKGVKHNAWDYAFSDREMFYWMFSQSKNGNSAPANNYANVFSIKDSNGNIIITDKDVMKTSYRTEVNDKNKMVIELTLTSKGHLNLEKAYTSSNGSPFTFYYMGQKVYSFTATTPPNDKVFSIVGVFSLNNYLTFYKGIRKTN